MQMAGPLGTRSLDGAPHRSGRPPRCRRQATAPRGGSNLPESRSPAQVWLGLLAHSRSRPGMSIRLLLRAAETVMNTVLNVLGIISCERPVREKTNTCDAVTGAQDGHVEPQNWEGPHQLILSLRLGLAAGAIKAKTYTTLPFGVCKPDKESSLENTPWVQQTGRWETQPQCSRRWAFWAVEERPEGRASVVSIPTVSSALPTSKPGQ